MKIAGPVLALADPAVQSAVLLAAMPTGTGAFLLAEHSGREIARSSRVILATTALSVLTLPAFLALLPGPAAAMR